MGRSPVKYPYILVMMLAACNTEAAREEADGQVRSETETQAAPGSATGDPSVVHHPEPPARPEQKPDSIQVEGTFERFTATLVKPPTDLPFSTYVAKDMIFESSSSDEGQGLFFYTNFAGKRNDNAFLLVFLMPQGATQADAQRLANAFATSRRQNKQIVRARLGNVQNRFFYVAETYPQEYGDGFGPRADYIRKQWVWLNDGKPLDATLQPQP
jgi:hypothetical protein